MRHRLAVPAVVLSLLAGAGAAASDAAAADPRVSVDVAPSAPQVDEQVTVSGDVTDADGQPASSAPLQATRKDSAGSHPLTVDMTDSSGHYSFHDVPTVSGQVTWTVTWQAVSGDVSGEQTVTVSRHPTSLRLTVSDTQVTSGTTVRLDAHLRTASADRTVSIYARPYHQSRRLVERGAAGATGELQANYDVERRTTFIARYDGNSSYAPSADRRLVKARARVVNHLAGGYATSHGFRLYHVGDNPAVTAHLHPELGDVCLYFRAQRRYLGAWHTTAVSDCVRTGAQGRESSELKGDHVVDKPYRVRAEWHGSPAALPDDGRWLRLRFRG